MRGGIYCLKAAAIEWVSADSEMICGFYINELAKHIGVPPKNNPKPYGSGKIRKDGMNIKKGRLIGALTVVALVALAFVVVSNTVLADPGGGQVVISQDLTINTPPVTIQATLALNASPPADSVVNNANQIATSPQITIIAANTSTITVTATQAIDQGTFHNEASTANTSRQAMAVVNANQARNGPTVTTTVNQNTANTDAQTNDADTVGAELATATQVEDGTVEFAA